MNRQSPSALAGAAVIFMTVAPAVGNAVAHEAKMENRSTTQPAGGQVEQSAPLRRMDPAVMRTAEQ